MGRKGWIAGAALVGLAGAGVVAGAHAPQPPSEGAGPLAGLHDPKERHLTNVKQLTFGGQNAEAYWSFDGVPQSIERLTSTRRCAVTISSSSNCLT